MYKIADKDYEQISSPARYIPDRYDARYIFVFDPDFVKGRIREDGTFEAKIEDLILLTSEPTVISAGLEALEDLVSKISKETTEYSIPTDSKFDTAVHETKYEEFQRRYKIQ